MDKIFIHGLTFPAIIGVLDWERTQPQTLRLDLEMAYDITTAAKSGRIEDALDYARVASFAQQVAVSGQFRLVETLAEALAQGVAETFRVSRIRVRVTKPEALAEAEGVGVEIERSFNV